MSKKLWHPTSGALVAGCLMVTAAHAQTNPITPMTELAAPLATAPVPERVAAPVKAPAPLGLDLQFRDITVKELLSTLGGQFGINISVDDSVDGSIGYINLTNSTPIEALETVIQTRPDLSLRQLSNGNYIVTKLLPGAQSQSIAGAITPNFGQGGFQGQPTSPGQGLGNQFDLPNSNRGFGNTPLFTDNQGMIGAGALGSALPGLGQANPMLGDLPTLVQANNGSGERRQRLIKIKYVPSSLVAYQLDPVNNALPKQLRSSENNALNYGRQPIARNALDNGRDGVSTGFASFNQNDFSSNQSNPYLQNAVSSLVRPEVRANSQFGGRGGQGGQGGRGNQNGNQGGGLGGGGNGAANAGGSFELPGDIEQIVSVDPQNVLLVAGGSDEDIRRLQELIDVLDQPLRQVEIEAQFVELQSQDARTFGIDFSTSRGNFDAATTGLASSPVQGAFQLGFVRNNFQARLNALIADNRAKVITAPRVTAINNLTASLFSTESRSLILTSVSQNIGGQQQQGQQLLSINTQTGLTVTPTINGDDTVTVLMQPQVTSQDGTTGLGTITQRTLETIANVRDGDTIALGGLKVVRNNSQNFKVPLLGDIPLIGGLFRSKTVTENESELIIFLTARILRRAGDDINITVPGT